MKILMIGGDFWHSAGAYYSMLKNNISNKVDYTSHIKLITNTKLDTYDVLIITKSFYEADSSGKLTQKTIGKLEEKKIKKFVENGKGLFFLHAGITIRKENKILIDITKGMFINHPPICQYELYFKKNIFNQPRYKLKDELYHVTTKEKQTNVFSWAISKKYGKHIAGWRHEYKKGRVAVFTPAHIKESIECKNYIKSVKKILEWLASKGEK